MELEKTVFGDCHCCKREGRHAFPLMETQRRAAKTQQQVRDKNNRESRPNGLPTGQPRCRCHLIFSLQNTNVFSTDSRSANRFHCRSGGSICFVPRKVNYGNSFSPRLLKSEKTNGQKYYTHYHIEHTARRSMKNGRESQIFHSLCHKLFSEVKYCGRAF